MEFKKAYKEIESAKRFFWRYKRYKFIHLFINYKSWLSNEYRTNEAYIQFKDILNLVKHKNIELAYDGIRIFKNRTDNDFRLYRPYIDRKVLGLSKTSNTGSNDLPF